MTQHLLAIDIGVVLYCNGFSGTNQAGVCRLLSDLSLVNPTSVFSWKPSDPSVDSGSNSGDHDTTI